MSDNGYNVKQPSEKGGPAFIDGRDIPPYCVLFTNEVMSPEVRGLSRAGLIMWLLVNIRCNKRDVEVDRQWHLSWAQLVAETELSRASVGRALKELEDADLIKRNRHGIGKVNQIILYSPASLIPKTVKIKESQNCDPSSHESETIEGSSSDTLNIFSETSSPTESQCVPAETNLIQSQAFEEEDIADVCYCWNSMLDNSRYAVTIREELRQLYLCQHSHFLAAMVTQFNEKAEFVREVIETPGFYQEMFELSPWRPTEPRSPTSEDVQE